MRHWETISPLIAALYEAAVYPALWEQVLDRFCELAQAEAGFLFSSDGSSQNNVFTKRGAEIFSSFVAGGWLERNERMFRMLEKKQHGFIHDLDLFEAEEMNNIPVYREFLHPIGLGSGVGTFVQSPNNNQMILSLERPLIIGPVSSDLVEILDVVRPHLARAVMLTIEVQKRQTDFTLMGLSLVGIPAAVISGNAKLIAANTLFTDLQSQIFLRAFNRISLRDKGADELLRSALVAVRTDDAKSVRSIPVAATENDPAFVVHMLPLRNEAQSFSTEGDAILFVSQADSAGEVSTSLLRGLYDLTNAEAKLTKCILSGQNLRQASASLGVSYETARTFAKSIYAKTGSVGQSDLIRRLSFVQRI